MSVPRAGDREVQTIAARFFLVELMEMMCEKKSEVKRGLPPTLWNKGANSKRIKLGKVPSSVFAGP
jgi:hypothetical protein